MLTDGFEWLHTMQQAYMTDPVTIQRGIYTTNADAVIADVDHKFTDARGAVTTATLRHFIIAIDKYKINSVAVEPAIGDAITSDGRTYTVNRLDGGPCWRYTDSTCLSYRVYTSLTGEA